MATSKSEALAKQQAREKQQATLDEILKHVKGTPVKGETLEAEESPLLAEILERVKALETEVKGLRAELAASKPDETKFSQAAKNVTRK